MTDGPIPRKTRRPFVWRPPQGARLADLLTGPEGRRRLLAYWRRDGVLDLGQTLGFGLFRVLPLPPRFVSWLGGWIARLGGRLKQQAWIRQLLHDKLARIHPGLDAAGREKLVEAFFDNYGRVTAEYALLNRLNAAGRISHENGAAVLALQAQGPLILLGLHLANWETICPVSAQLGIRPAFISKPPARTVSHRLSVRVRESFGAYLLPPGKAGTRPALRTLQSGGILCLFGDEEHEDRSMAPFFGRPGHLNGNLAITARLARMTGAKIIVFHGERRPGGNYVIVFENPLPLPSQTLPDAPLMEDVLALNAAIEPIIRAHSGSWYMLPYPQVV